MTAEAGHRLSGEATAKVNLFLRVLSRETAGYHGIETLFCRIALADDLVVQRTGTAPDEPRLVQGLNAFEQTFSTYHRLLTGEAPPAGPPADATDVVAIDDLLYRGRRALERADAVRLQLSDALKRSNAYLDIEPLVSELIDLVPLALTD